MNKTGVKVKFLKFLLEDSDFSLFVVPLQKWSIDRLKRQALRLRKSKVGQLF